MKRALFRATLVSFLLSFLVAVGLYAEEKAGSYEDCMSSFDIEAAIHDPVAVPYISLLKEYFACSAAAKNDVEQCSKLSDTDAIRACQKYMQRYWLFYGRLLREGKATSTVLDACRSSSEDPKDADLCEDYSAAILNNDPSRCEKFTDPNKKNFCLAAARRDVSVSRDNEWRGKIYFLKAVAEGDPKICDSIIWRSKDSDRSNKTYEWLKWICKGGASNNISVCEQNSGFERFKEAYCAKKASGNSQADTALGKKQESE